MSNKLFNTPFELSLHVVLLLNVTGAGLTLDRIAAYDFIAIYCEDFGIADRSLNGENGFAFSELSSRRNLTKAAIKDLVVDGLVVVTDDETGILYSISESGRKMSKGFKSEYAENYKKLIREYRTLLLLRWKWNGL